MDYTLAVVKFAKSVNMGLLAVGPQGVGASCGVTCDHAGGVSLARCCTSGFLLVSSKAGPRPNIVAYNAAISACAHCGRPPNQFCHFPCKHVWMFDPEAAGKKL